MKMLRRHKIKLNLYIFGATFFFLSLLASGIAIMCIGMGTFVGSTRIMYDLPIGIASILGCIGIGAVSAMMVFDLIDRVHRLKRKFNR